MRNSLQVRLSKISKGEQKMADAVTEILTKTKECKMVVRYDNPAEDFKVIKTLYIHNKAYEKLGKPEKIALVIKAHD